MNWTRYKLLILSGGICLVLSGALVFWILSSQSQNTEIAGKISNLKSTQSRLYSQKPYPSEKNFEQLQKEQDKVIEQRDRLLTLMREGQLQPQRVSRNRFGEHIAKWVADRRAEAQASTKGGENGVVLTDPDFGLTEYLRGLPPEMARLPDLMLDLEVIEHLSGLLFESGISELVVIKRQVEESTRGSRNLPLMGPGDIAGFNQDPLAGRPGQDPAEEELDAKGRLRKEKDRLFDWEDYRVEFRVYEDFFWETLNQVVADPNQFVVKELTVTNSNEILWPRGLEPAVGKAEDRNSRRPRERRTPRRPAMDDWEMLLQGGDGSADSPAVDPENEVRIAGLKERRGNTVGADLLNVAMVVRLYRLTDEIPENGEEL